MDFSAIVDSVKTKFPLTEVEFEKNLVLQPDDLSPFVEFIRTTFDVNVLDLLTACDHPAGRQIHLVYGFYSYRRKLFIHVKVRLTREKPVVASMTKFWEAANWLEREVFDLYGVHFEGHPDLRRILTPPDFVGHGLRKDYERPGFFVKKPDFK